MKATLHTTQRPAPHPVAARRPPRRRAGTLALGALLLLAGCGSLDEPGRRGKPTRRG